MAVAGREQTADDAFVALSQVRPRAAVGRDLEVVVGSRLSSRAVQLTVNARVAWLGGERPDPGLGAVVSVMNLADRGLHSSGRVAVVAEGPDPGAAQAVCVDEVVLGA